MSVEVPGSSWTFISMRKHIMYLPVTSTKYENKSIGVSKLVGGYLGSGVVRFFFNHRNERPPMSKVG